MATTQLSYTPTLGTLTKWTFSGWFKKSAPTGYQQMIAVPSGSAYTVIKFETAGQISFENYDSGGSVAGQLKTTRIFRDCSAWYHIVAVWDSANATPGDRMKLYVNGVEETAFTTDVNPDSSETSTMCANVVHWIGANNGSDYFDGCMSWVQLVDNAALAPTQFGSFDTTSGIWKISPGAYGTPGTAGFCLAFEDRSNLDLDTSSNAYTFTTAGGGLTATYDNPSNNFCTINPLDNYLAASTFSNGNNTLVTHSGNYSYNTGTMGLSAGLWYWEEKIGSSSSYDMVGIADNPTLSTTGWLGYYTYSYGYRSDTGQVYTGTSGSAYGGTYTTGDIIGVYLDLTANKLYFAKNGTLENSGTGVSITAAASTTHGHYLPGVGEYGSSSAGTYNLNFGNGYFGTTAVTSAVADEGGIGAFEYDPSAGTFDSASKDFRAICTKNIKAYGG